MHDQRDVNDETLGIRALQLKKSQAAQRAIEKMRRELTERWSELGSDEVDDLEWILGEMWAVTEGEEWDSLRFTRLTMGDLIAILDLGTQIKRHARPSIEILHDALALVEAAAKREVEEEIDLDEEY